jgi:hypothetical protein
MDILGVIFVGLLVVALVVVAGKGLVGKADQSEDDGIDYDSNGVILFGLNHRKNN